jgi:hypothetical protein
MRSPTTVDAAASADAYRALHAKWDEHVERETARLAALAPAALVADVPYLSLAAARQLGIPGFGLSSLNWADIYRAYCGGEREAPAILGVMEAAYRSADLFLQPRPHMKMADLPNRRSIGPIARIGQRRSDEIRALLHLSQHTQLVLVSLGGIPLEHRLRLPNIAGIHWLIGSACSAPSGSGTEVHKLGMSFIDILASSDAVVAKVGYCMFVEAACNGVALVSAPRDDWPESLGLIEWAKQNADFALAGAGLEDAQALRSALSMVLNASRRAPVPASGAAEASDIIAEGAGLS